MKTREFLFNDASTPLMVQYTICGNRVEEIAAVYLENDKDMTDIWELLTSRLQEAISIAADSDSAEPYGSEDQYDR